MASRKDKQITLKEAAELSGYSADYVGQLIRQGKIAGEQVYANVAWVTTEEAVLSYLNKTRSGDAKKDAGPSFLDSLTPEKLSNFYVTFGKIVLIAVSLFALFLLYVLAVSLDERMERSFLDKVEHTKSL